MKKTLPALKNEIVEVGRRVYERGYVASNDGNISARLDERRVVITPTGVSKGFMHARDLLVVDMDGRVISGRGTPSSETRLHLRIYKERPDVRSVCHAHPPYATGFAVAGIPLDQPLLPEVVITLGSIPLVPYETPGTEEFCLPMLPFLQGYDAFLLANHGALAVGTTVLGAYHRMETMEHAAQIAFVALQLGKTTPLTPDQVRKLVDQRSRYGIRTSIGGMTGNGDAE